MNKDQADALRRMALCREYGMDVAYQGNFEQIADQYESDQDQVVDWALEVYAVTRLPESNIFTEPAPKLSVQEIKDAARRYNRTVEHGEHAARLYGFFAHIQDNSKPRKTRTWSEVGHGFTLAEAMEEALAIHRGEQKTSNRSANLFEKNQGPGYKVNQD